MRDGISSARPHRHERVGRQLRSLGHRRGLGPRRRRRVDAHAARRRRRGHELVDTADVYGDGRSERLLAHLRRERPGETIHVTTNAGRRLPQQTPEGYSRRNLTTWIERSLRNLEMDAVDFLQLHCPYTKVYDGPEVFERSRAR